MSAQILLDLSANTKWFSCRFWQQWIQSHISVRIPSWRATRAGLGNCLSSVRNILHGPALSFGFSSLRPSLEKKPQEKTVQQFGLQSIRRAVLFVIFSRCNFFSFFLSFCLGASLELEAQYWMRRWNLLCPKSKEWLSVYASQQERRVSCHGRGTDVEKENRHCAFTYLHSFWIKQK